MSDGPTSDDERPALGALLAAARESQGRSTGELARSINLRETVLTAIERDDFSLCGGDVYARGHIRAYAVQVGLDPEPLLAAHRALSGSARRRPTPAAPAVGSARPVTTARPFALRDNGLERSGPSWTLVVGAALVVLVAFLGVRLVGDLTGPARPTTAVADPSATRPAPTGTRPTSTPATGAPAPSSPPSGPATAPPSGATAPVTPTSGRAGVAVGLKFTGQSWVSVSDAGGRTVFSGVLGTGQNKMFTDTKRLKLTLGNAGAVLLTVNGKAIGSAGTNGQVVRLQFGPGDPA